MTIFVGTSGYSYKEWKGKFYPRDIKPAEMLSFYAERFGAVEINNTFYKMPEKKVVQSWTKQVPKSFKFGLKAPQKITHIRRLKNIESDLEHFLDVAAVLKKQLGPLLFQFPGNFRKDINRLERLLKRLPKKFCVAFEFRNSTWFDDEVFASLRKRNAALCIAESEEAVEVPYEATADWGYLRLRRLDYGRPALKKWFEKTQKQRWSEAHVFFRHENQALGPKFAAIFSEFTNQQRKSAPQRFDFSRTRFESSVCA